MVYAAVDPYLEGDLEVSTIHTILQGSLIQARANRSYIQHGKADGKPVSQR